MNKKYLIEVINLKDVNQKGYLHDQDSEDKKALKLFNEEKEAQRWMVSNIDLLRPGWGHTIKLVFFVELKEVEG